MYRTIITGAFLALSACAVAPGPSSAVEPVSLTGASSAALPAEVPVVEIAATARFGAGAACEDRPPPGSRIRGLRCYDERARKLSYQEFMSMPDGLKPAAAIFQR